MLQPFALCVPSCHARRMETRSQERAKTELAAADEDRSEKRQSDSFFDQWLGAHGEALRSLVSSVQTDLLAYEVRTKLRRSAGYIRGV
jgi:hypothetical protein